MTSYGDYRVANTRNGNATSVSEALIEGHRAIDTASSRKFHNGVSDGRGVAGAVKSSKQKSHPLKYLGSTKNIQLRTGNLTRGPTMSAMIFGYRY